MIPGFVSKLSESSVTAAATIGPPKSDILYLSGSTTIATIRPPGGPGGFSSVLFIVPLTDAVATTTTGNIAVNVTMPVDRVTVLVYSKQEDTWFPGAIS